MSPSTLGRGGEGLICIILSLPLPWVVAGEGFICIDLRVEVGEGLICCICEGHICCREGGGPLILCLLYGGEGVISIIRSVSPPSLGVGGGHLDYLARLKSGSLASCTIHHHQVQMRGGGGGEGD